jgi:hypothetical protein
MKEPVHVSIVYNAHLNVPGAEHAVQWSATAYLSPDDFVDGPGHLLARDTGGYGGIVVHGEYLPLSSINRITWEISEL